MRYSRTGRARKRGGKPLFTGPMRREDTPCVKSAIVWGCIIRASAWPCESMKKDNDQPVISRPDPHFSFPWKRPDDGPWAHIPWKRLRLFHFPTFSSWFKDYLKSKVRKILDTTPNSLLAVNSSRYQSNGAVAGTCHRGADLLDFDLIVAGSNHAAIVQPANRPGK